MKNVVFILCALVALSVAAPFEAAGQRPERQQRRAERVAGREAAREAARAGKQAANQARRATVRRNDVAQIDVTTDSRGDTVAITLHLVPVPVFSKPVDMSQHKKLVRDFRKVYPLAIVARQKMAGFEEQLLALPTRKEQRRFSKATEKALVAEYEPTMRRMTVSQGRILVRLIDRETEMTSHAIIKEFRGGFVAGFWQGVARIFGHNLKDEYDPAERDRLIEQCISMYNAGLLPNY